MSTKDTLVTVRREDLLYWIYRGLLMDAHDDAGVDNWSGRDMVEWPDEETAALDIMDKMESIATKGGC